MNNMEQEKTFEQQVAELNLQVSNHAMDRYKERVAGNTINNLDDATKARYTEELKKLFLSSDKVYTGIIGRSTDQVDVYLNRNGWTLICGKNTKQVITLYKVDLGIDDDELNQTYVTKSLEKIYKIIDEIKVINDEVETNKIKYMEEQDQNKALIKDLKNKISNLEKRNEDLDSVIKSEGTRVYQSKLSLRNALQSYMIKDKLQIE